MRINDAHLCARHINLNLQLSGAQYGTLVDQKRTIQPALVSCKRASMFKAQQYGRWVILNRSKPMETLGQPVLHDDKVILEQEWFFLASSSPYQSSMYKTLNNSDEAMTTKMDLFQPGDECSWKIHLVALPSEDKAGELQRQLLLQQAKESIDDSAAMRYEKAPSLLTSLQSKLPAELTDESLFSNQLSRKMHQKENQEYLLNTYRQLGTKQFHSNYNPLKFLGKIYGPDSNIVRYKAFVLERNESEVPCGLYEQSQQAQHGSKDSHPDDVHKTSTERAHDDYWNSAQRVLVDTKSWVQLPSAMTKYYKGDRTKKIRAAMVLQKWIRKFLNSTFDFERAMKRIDQVARNKLQEKVQSTHSFMLDLFVIAHWNINFHPFACLFATANRPTQVPAGARQHDGDGRHVTRPQRLYEVQLLHHHCGSWPRPQQAPRPLHAWRRHRQYGRKSTSEPARARAYGQPVRLAQRGSAHSHLSGRWQWFAQSQHGGAAAQQIDVQLDPLAEHLPDQ